jgi:hypothetical protein
MCYDEKIRAPFDVRISDDGDLDIECAHHKVTVFHCCNGSIDKLLRDIAGEPCAECEKEKHEESVH